ncbi:hypothetical protein GC176_27525 [bacterium]|nr:hypothetical protein [bacterium]
MKHSACSMALFAALISGCAATQTAARHTVTSPIQPKTESASLTALSREASMASGDVHWKPPAVAGDAVVHAVASGSSPAVLQLASAETSAEPNPVPPAPAPAASIEHSETESPEMVPDTRRSALGSPSTLEAFEQLALQNNPTLRMAEAEIEKERGNWTQVGLYPNPTVGYLRSDAASSGGGRTDGAFVQQTLITGGKLRLNREIETFGIQDTVAQHEAQVQRVRNDVRLRYYTTLAVQEELRLAEELVALARDGVKTAQRLYDAGEAPLSDVLQSEVQLQVFESARDRSEETYRLTWQHLVDMAGIPDHPPEQLAGEFPKDFPELDRDQLWQRLVETNGLLKSTQAQVGVTRKTLERQEVQPIPDVTVQVVGEVDHTNGSSTVSTLLALPVPLFDRNQGRIYNAWHDAARAEQEVERTRLVLKDQFALTYRDYETSRNEAQRMEDEILPRARQNLELVATGYQQGQFDLPRVLDARQTLFEMNMTWLNARSQAQQARMELEGQLLTGGLNPATIGTAIQGGAEGGDRRRGVLQNLQQQQGARLNLFNPGTTQ